MAMFPPGHPMGPLPLPAYGHPQGHTIPVLYRVVPAVNQQHAFAPPYATNSITTKALVPDHLKAPSKAIDFSNQAVIVKVGTPFKVFLANEKLLCTSSAYLSTALNGRWEEGKTKVIELATDDETAFNIYLNWLHSRKIYAGYEDGRVGNGNWAWPSLIRCYCLGDKLLDGDFKDAIIDAMLLAHSNDFFPHTDDVYQLYDNTVRDAPARMFMAYLFACAKSPDLVTDEDPPTFLRDYSNALVEGAEGIESAVADCRFHEHVDGAENCYRNKSI